MEMYQGSSTQQPAAICALKSPADAIHILEAVRLGLVPRVTRRLTGHERAMIRPGTVWVWEEEETNMRRWTDGRRWGASRVGGGGFLVYTESSDTQSPPPSRSESPFPPVHNAGYYPGPSSSRRPESLIKQTYSTTMTNPATGKVKKFHVVAYSSKHNPQGDAHNPFPLPYQLPSLSTLKVAPGIWPEWEHRREPELPVRRPGQPGPYPSSSQSAPVTAMSSPSGSHYTPQVPPTAYPRPPSPRRDLFARPFPSPMADGPFDPRNPAGLPRSVSGPFAQTYQPSGRTQSIDNSPIAYSGRHGSLPPTYDSPSSYNSERYHPYAAPPRSSGGRATYPPTPSMSGSTPTSSMSNIPHESPSSTDRVGLSPTTSFSSYQRPSSSHGGPVHQPRTMSNDILPPSRYTQPPAYDRIAPDNKAQIHLGESPHTDPRRYPTADPTAPGQARQASNPNRLPSSSGITINVNQANSTSQLIPPGPSTPSGRSPKMSIASTLLNQDASNHITAAPGAGQGTTSLTLPPLRVNMDGGSRDRSPMLPSPGHISPRMPEMGSPTDNLKLKTDGGKGWGEDARQLGELGKRVVL